MKKQACGVQEHEHRIESAKRNMPEFSVLEGAGEVFRALAEPSRLKILMVLSGGELCVYHIVEACEWNQSAVSHQLRVLKDAGLVKARKDGQSVLYSIADSRVEQFLRLAGLGA